MPRKKLIWKSGFSLTRKPTKTPRHRMRVASARPEGSRKFEFVWEHPVSSEPPVPSLPNDDSVTLAAAVAHAPDPSVGSESNGADGCHIVSSQWETSSQSPAVDSPQAVGSSIFSRSLVHHSPVVLQQGGEYAQADHAERRCNVLEPSPAPSTTQCARAISFDLARENRRESNELYCDESPRLCHPSSVEFATRRSREPFHDVTRSPKSDVNFSPLTVLHNDLLHHCEPILFRYNQEFCRIPLTTDLQINPFRFQRRMTPEPNFLVHTVMALAGHHVKSSQTQHHRLASLRLMREELGRGSLKKAHMLDAIILLFSLDETQSALGNWSTHLVGAYAILKANAASNQWQTSPRTVVQVALLTWWDAILSLVAREDCVFPLAYFEAIAEVHDEDDWDYFGLCGCPLTLVQHVMQLARISAEKRKSVAMHHVTFSDDIITDMEQSLESWRYIPSSAADENEESLHHDQDQMHCSEAWRNGLLLYIYRVYYWKVGEKVPMRFLSRARTIADHIFACRDDSMVARQALLPLFFAGCELRDPSTRSKIVRYCADWDEKTRYHMFSSTIPLLQKVWAEQEEKGFQNTWWGQIVDDQHTVNFQYHLQTRLCFG